MKDDSRADKSEVQTCDLLVRNGYVITMDADGSKYRKGEVAITGRNIVAVGPENEVASKFRPKRVLDAGGAAVHPGYIDLHYHSPNHIVSKMVEDFLAFDGPAFLDVIIDPEASVYPMVGPGLSYRDMITGDFIPNRYDGRDPSAPDSSEMF